MMGSNEWGGFWKSMSDAVTLPKEDLLLRCAADQAPRVEVQSRRGSVRVAFVFLGQGEKEVCTERKTQSWDVLRP